MSAQHFPEAGNPAAGHKEEMMSALFAQLVLQQSNMAMMLMGKVAHPETGKAEKNMEAAKLFIDLLDMLEVKTRGNLSKEEAGLLKQTLMSLHLTFVEAVESSPAPAQETEQKPPETGAEPKPTESEPVPGGAQEEDHRKKFSKKY